MEQKIAIIGCGTVGANLSIELAKNRIHELMIFDPDCVYCSDDSYPFTPFLKEHKNLYKVDVIKFLVKKHSLNNTKVIISYDKVKSPLKDKSYFVIDCRDRKDENIKSNMEISLDGKYLHISSTDYSDSLKGRPFKYIFEKSEFYLNKALKEILKYIQTNEYSLKQYREYDLDDLQYSVLTF